MSGFSVDNTGGPKAIATKGKTPEAVVPAAPAPVIAGDTRIPSRAVERRETPAAKPPVNSKELTLGAAGLFGGLVVVAKGFFVANAAGTSTAILGLSLGMAALGAVGLVVGGLWVAKSGLLGAKAQDVATTSLEGLGSLFGKIGKAIWP